MVSHSDFQNRRAAATLTSSAQGNPFRTLPKGKTPPFFRWAKTALNAFFHLKSLLHVKAVPNSRLPQRQYPQQQM
jgi:hypothetical protein